MKVFTKNKIYYNASGDEDKLAKANTAIAGAAALGNIAGIVANKPQRQLAEIEQKCGKKPTIFGKGKWQNCVDNINHPEVKGPIQEPKNSDNNIMVIGGVVLGLAVLVGVIYAVKKKSK